MTPQEAPQTALQEEPMLISPPSPAPLISDVIKNGAAQIAKMNAEQVQSPLVAPAEASAQVPADAGPAPVGQPPEVAGPAVQSRALSAEEATAVMARLTEMEAVNASLLDDIDRLSQQVVMLTEQNKQWSLAFASEQARNRVDFGITVGDQTFDSPNALWNRLDELGKQVVSIAMVAMFRTDIFRTHVQYQMIPVGELMAHPEHHAATLQRLEAEYQRLFAQAQAQGQLPPVR